MIAQCAVFALGLLAASAAAQSCPDSIRLLFNPQPSVPAHGKNMKVHFTLSNLSGLKIDSSAVTIGLPDTATYVASGMKMRAAGAGKGARGTVAGSEVTWANAGSVPAGKSSSFWVEATVGQDAELLRFSAAAMLSVEGQACVVAPLDNDVRAKGYKYAVPPPPPPPPSTAYPFSGSLDCGNGYNEQTIFSAEGIDVVYACWEGGDTVPTELNSLLSLNCKNAASSKIVWANFVRPSAGLSEVGPVALGDWWGYASVGTMIGSGAQEQVSDGILGVCYLEDKGATNANYDETSIGLGNDLGGFLGFGSSGGAYQGIVGVNLQTGDNGSMFYYGSWVFYRPSGTQRLPIVA